MRNHTLEELLLELGLGDLDLDGLVHLLLVSAFVVGVVLDRGGEQRVDEGRLSNTGLTSNLRITKSARTIDACCKRRYIGVMYQTYHDSEASSPLGDNLVSLVREVGDTNR
jgi:hypothetical protein